MYLTYLVMSSECLLEGPCDLFVAPSPLPVAENSVSGIAE